MKLILDIELKGNAFYAGPAGNELARILTDLAGKLEDMDFAELSRSQWTMYEFEGQPLGEAKIVE